MVRHALRLVVVLGTVLAAAGAAAQDVRHSAIPDFDAVAAANRGFGGFYVAGGLGYGLPAHRDFSLVDGFACPGTNVPYLGPVSLGGGSGCRTSAGLSGLTAHLLAGWNFGAGQGWISGVELRGRLGREAGTGRLGGSSVVSIPGLAPYTNTASGTYRAGIDSGLAVTGRFGYAFSGFMPFLNGAPFRAGRFRRHGIALLHGRAAGFLHLRRTGGEPHRPLAALGRLRRRRRGAARPRLRTPRR